MFIQLFDPNSDTPNMPRHVAVGPEYQVTLSEQYKRKSILGIKWDYDQIEEDIRNWLKENMNYSYGFCPPVRYYGTVYFTDRNDAMLFKLTWG